jgi:hypothetical protein
MSSPSSPAGAGAEAGFPTAPPVPRRVLPVIVFAQLLGTSPWFAVNAVMPDLQAAYAHQGWPVAAVATLSSSLQIGFIVGTLVFALLAVPTASRPAASFSSVRWPAASPRWRRRRWRRPTVRWSPGAPSPASSSPASIPWA